MKRQMLVGALFLMGCRKPPPVEQHYYSLVLEASQSRPAPEPGTPTARVDLVEVNLPDFLMSRSLVMQVNSNEVKPARHHHWGEPLEVSLRKVLAADLSDALPQLDIAPGQGRGADCTLHLHFDRFHATHQARVAVSGRYVFRTEEQVLRREFDVSQVQQGNGYSHAVQAMRRGVAALAAELRPVVEGCTAAGADR